MNLDSLSLAEELVQELAPLLKQLEITMTAKRPETEMRESYRFLRELKKKRLVTDDEFEILYARLNDLSDALQSQESFFVCVSNVLVLLDSIPAREVRQLTLLVNEISRHPPTAYSQLYAEYYSWVKHVFSEPSKYSSHLLQTRDESVLGVSPIERESALLETPKIMQSIRDCSEALGSPNRHRIVDLTKSIERLLQV